MNRRAAPLIAATALISIVVVAGVAGGMNSGDDDSAPSASAPTAVGAGVAAPASPVSVVPPVSTTPSTEPVVKTQLGQTLAMGMVGGDVKMVQERLKAIGFEPGPIDGNFGNLTRQAVWAFEKLVMGTPRAEATGRVTNEMWQRMQDPLVIAPLRPDAETTDHTEIYLPEQVAIFFVDDKPALIVHISSGTGEYWEQDVTISPGEYGNEDGTEDIHRRERGLSVTPGGVYHYDRMVEGVRQSALGGLWNPAYFNYGIAIHGAQNVPLEPASHGCVRMAEVISRTFHEYIEKGDEVYVFDGIKDPEDYGSQLPPFNTVLTTTTTSTLPPATAAPRPSSTAVTGPPTTRPPVQPPPTQAPVPPQTPAPTSPPTTAPPATTVAVTDAGHGG